MEYKEICKRNKKEENNRWERKTAEVRRESDMWKIVNRERRKRKRMNEGMEGTFHEVVRRGGRKGS